MSELPIASTTLNSEGASEQWVKVMKTIDHHDARGPEETVHDLSPVVPAKPASGNSTTSLRESGMPDGAPSEDPDKLAQSKPRLRH